MKIDREEPYSLERAVTINTAIKLCTGMAMHINGTPFHLGSDDKQRQYWREFLSLAKDRLGE